MEFRVLGPLVVVDDEGIEVPLKGTRLRALLGLLALHVGEVVAADRVTEELWGDDLPVDATAALQTQVSRLRAALRAGGVPDCIETRKPGYVLAVDPGCVDAHRFEATARVGRELLDAGDPAAAATVLADALSLWRGDLLADLAGEHLAPAEHARLAELRRTALEDRVDADLGAGRHQELVGELEALVAAEPLREHRTAQLVLALYRSGRQADALRAYQATREVLAEELGIEPGAELRRLEAAVLAQDPALDPPVVKRAPRPSTATHPELRIAAPLTRLIGRVEELSRARQLLADHRLVTVVGPGGAGKTRLAIETGRQVTERFADGAALVELAPVEDPSALAGVIARILGADAPRDAAAPDELLATLVGDRSLLLLLDNCEHLLDDVARMVTTLLGRCPNLSVLATSRQGLGIPGEVSLLVPPMEREAAVALFAERGASAMPSFTVDDGNRAEVGALCAHLDDMPLAIELAASRLRVFSLTQLADRLQDRFRVVAGGARGALPRQQTLRAVVDWSYDLLDPTEQLVFERLSVFAAGCSLEAAEAVCAGDGVEPAEVADVLGRLVDKSLVVATAVDDGIRFTMLQTLSEYARERLAEGNEDGPRRRLCEWLLAQAKIGEVIDGSRASFALGFGRELDNVRVGIGWAIEHDPALAVEIAARLVWYWSFNDAQVDGYHALMQGLAREPELTVEIRTRALTWAGLLAGNLGEVELGERLGNEALALARTSGDVRLIGRTAVLRAERLIDRGDIEAARSLLVEARRCLEEAGDAFSLAYVDLREGFADTYLGHAAQAYWATHRALRQFRHLGDVGLITTALQRLGECADVCGYAEEASAALEEAIALNDGLPGVGRHSQLRSRLARVRVNQGRLEEALALAEESVDLAGRQTWGLVTGMALQARGRTLGAMGRLEEAVADLETAVARIDEVGVPALAASIRGELDDLRARV